MSVDVTIELKVKEGETAKECAKRNGLDMRYSYGIYGNTLVRNIRVTRPCSGCDGDGCDECGYTGKRRDCFPYMISITSKQNL